MWEYTDTNAHTRISLHDCRVDQITLDGNDLILNFYDGFWILPTSGYIDHPVPLKTGPAQLCFRDMDVFPIDLYKTTRLFRRPVFCRRIRIELDRFIKLVNDDNRELEFLYEYHRPFNNLYQCWLWSKKPRFWGECQFELTSDTIEYRWNEIRPDYEW